MSCVQMTHTHTQTQTHTFIYIRRSDEKRTERYEEIKACTHIKTLRSAGK